MKVAIVSDTHYAVDKFKKLLTFLQSENIQYVIHAGDFIGNNIASVFSAFPSISFFVARGNCDYNGQVMDALKDTRNVQVNDILRFQIDGISFIVSHIPGTAFNEQSRNAADVVIHGHTHQPRVDNYKNALVLNPGSLMDGDGYMILELPELNVDRRFNY